MSKIKTFYGLPDKVNFVLSVSCRIKDRTQR